jgi:hypothetical protein
VDREAMARRQRRRQIEEALADERGREAVLAAQLEEVVAESDGPGVDAQVFERLDPDDVAVVREVLEIPVADEYDPEEDEEPFVFEIGGDEDGSDDELARLQDEIAGSRRRQQALQRYLDALDA